LTAFHAKKDQSYLMTFSGWEEGAGDGKEDFQKFVYLHKFFHSLTDELPLQSSLFLTNINPRMKIKIQRD
jgi:hypothetical protein